MSDTMKVQSFATLLRWILGEHAEAYSIFGIHQSLFYRPSREAPFTRDDVYGHHLGTPIGPAAGPHTQLAPNIICSWLSGGRFIELKTVQVMDELEIPRPCIDMADEGYNVEWSQELKLDESASEYINAWALIHVLRRHLGFDRDAPFGTVFNMSVGYNLEGIQSPAMVRFMDRLDDASEEIAAIQEVLRKEFPRFADIQIPTRITNSVTLSTMHGCPPDEIERIARHLLEDRGLHTSVKMNPTLLGRKKVNALLHDELGYREIQIPDATFEHDLRYDRAIELIRSLRSVAAKKGLTFGVKLSNTLPAANHRGALPGDEMYMSGRALYPITVNLFHKLVREFDGDLLVSYSGGADAHNVATLLASGAQTVTAVTDLLKPGGYSLFLQYLERIDQEMARRGAETLDDLAADGLTNLEDEARSAPKDRRYQKGYHRPELPKVDSGLELFDCVTAPCVERCAVNQDVPEYAWLIARGEHDRALETILARNPLPGVTGHVCTHICEDCCTRNNYDEPVAIRALKRFAVEKGSVARRAAPDTGRKVAVIGSGPSGLAAASFLALCGVQATIFEAKDVPGGMLGIAPAFRLPRKVIQEDIDRITSLGVEIKLNHRIDSPPEELLNQGFDAVYVASGFQEDVRPDMEGVDGDGVITGLELLERISRGDAPDLGKNVLVIGGGNTAMDAARTAGRLIGEPVTVVYRRSRDEMPATDEEVTGLIEERNVLKTLLSPSRIILEEGRVVALECVRNRLGEPGPDGRRSPVPVEGSETRIDADTVIVAIGQGADVAFLDGSSLTLGKNGAIRIDPETGLAGSNLVFAGGDAVRGPAIIIEACADGRRAAEAICAKLDVSLPSLPSPLPVLSDEEVLEAKRERARKEPRRSANEFLGPDRRSFGLIEQTFTERDARAEAARCLQCSTFCDKCIEVCPNRANYSYRVSLVDAKLPLLTCRDGRLVESGEEPIHVGDERQIIHLDDFCNECGNCATFCVHEGKPYLEKPRLFFRETDFMKERDNAFHIESNTIRRRESGDESRLTVTEDGYLYEDRHVRISLTPEFAIDESELKVPFDGTYSIRGIVEMALILDGVTRSASFLKS